MTIDERIAAELRRHAPRVDERKAWERIESAAPAYRRSRATRLVAVPVAAAGLLVVASTLISIPSARPGPSAPVGSPFEGTWLATDLDGSSSRMVIEVSADAVDMVVHDDLASVCSGAGSTMTGTGRYTSDGDLVFPDPVLTCDDGSQPEAVSGPPVDRQLENLTFVHDREADRLTDGFGVVWIREGSTPNTNALSRWPESSPEQVQRAQAGADDGDPDYTWQLSSRLASEQEPWGEEIFTRFVRDELGWEQFDSGFHIDGYGTSDGHYEGVVFIRCALHETNPLYPTNPVASGCAPTIDDHRYERVSLAASQPGRRGATGIWVISGWEVLEPLRQVVPPTVGEAEELLNAFLGARIAGAGAEPYLDGTPLPLLYATSSGLPYQRFEHELRSRPEEAWPDGHGVFQVTLFAEDGATVVRQLITVHRNQSGGLVLGIDESGSAPATTENGRAVAEPYGLLDGDVTFAAEPPWTCCGFMRYDHGPKLATLYLDRQQKSMAVAADPTSVGSGCESGPKPRDVEALVESIRSDPDFEVTEPVTTTIGGLPAFQIDVTAAPDASDCDGAGPAVLLTDDSEPNSPRGVWGSRMRLYLLQAPLDSARILAVAISATEDSFDEVMRAAVPVLDSLEINGK